MKLFKSIAFTTVFLISLVGVGCDSDGEMIDSMFTLEGVSMLRDDTALGLFQLDADGEPSSLDGLALVIAD